MCYYLGEYAMIYKNENEEFILNNVLLWMHTM